MRAGYRRVGHWLPRLGESHGQCRHSDALCEQVHQLRDEGLSERGIGKVLGMPRWTVRGILSGDRRGGVADEFRVVPDAPSKVLRPAVDLAAKAELIEVLKRRALASRQPSKKAADGRRPRPPDATAGLASALQAWGNAGVGAYRSDTDGDCVNRSET